MVSPLGFILAVCFSKHQASALGLYRRLTQGIGPAMRQPHDLILEVIPGAPGETVLRRRVLHAWLGKRGKGLAQFLHTTQRTKHCVHNLYYQRKGRSLRGRTAKARLQQTETVSVYLAIYLLRGF